ncbi:hypothetical protein E2C01_050816 [Portunus trituberculatus]|uniref:Uncharacterized protein n=2 Tax=Portunus trituberculatus TaxID=210409 RepID=A0A5B7G9B4_PORTR|nr:hypothetical protein [Portunus trituberculatus]
MVAAMVVDVMAKPACENNMSTAQLRDLPLVKKPLSELLAKVSDDQLATRVYECFTQDGMDCGPCRQGELGQVVALLPVMLVDCQSSISNVCPSDLKEKSAKVVNAMSSTYRGTRYNEILLRL